MSQGLRKGLEGHANDKTDLTPPTRIDDQRNSRRAQQITHLHQQFEDLKKKIKEVENKNEKIIEKIHKAYNFKKKNAYTQQYLAPSQTSPVVYYDHNRFDPTYSGDLSGDNKSKGSDPSQRQFKFQKRSSDNASRKMLKNQKFNYSMEYGKTDNNIAESPDAKQGQILRLSSQLGQAPPTYPPHNPTYSTSGSQSRIDRKLVDQLNQQKLALQQQLIDKQSQLYRIQSLMKNTNRNLKNYFQNSLEEFYQNVLQRNITVIQKSFKKYETKLKNLKRVVVVMKDKQEDRKSTRLLEAGRARRSQSRSRRNSPPRQSIKQKLSASRIEVKEESRSRSKFGADQIQKNKKQFQEIANKYEQIIKSKNQEIDKWDKKYRAKERQCYELKMRVDVLQKRLTEEQKKSLLRAESQSFDLKQNKRNSLESQILDQNEIDTSALEEKINKQRQTIQELQLIINKKSTEITNLENNLFTAESRAKQLYNEYQENSNKTKSKYQQEQQKYKKQFEKIINQKNDQILSYKSSLLATEKKYLEKQCQFFSLESKVKKTEGLLVSKEKKIEELEKLLENNCPTDRSLIINSAVFPHSDSNEPLKKLKQQIESLEAKLEANKNEIFGLTKKNSYYKSKTEELELQNTEMKREIESLHIENEQLKINVNMNNISAVMKGGDHDDHSRQEQQLVGESLCGIEETNKKANFDMDSLNLKILQLTKQKDQWYEKYQKAKNQSLEKQSDNIKAKSQLSFTKKQLEDSQGAYNKLKVQNENLKVENKQLGKKLATLEQQFQLEREEFKNQIDDIGKKWAEFEEDMKSSGFRPDIEKSERASMISTITKRNQIDMINTQNQYLAVKLKEAEAEIQAQKAMEQKIIQQYQVVLEQYKIEIKNKGEQIKMLKQQIQQLNIKIHNLNLRLQMANKNDSTNVSSRKQQKNQLFERLEELQAELKQAKEINSRLTDMEGQLFEQIKIKEEERAELYEQLRSKQLKIKQLQQIVDVRGYQSANLYGNHMEYSSHKRQSLKSQSSLKYSSHSQILRKSRLSNKGGSSQERGFDLELSDAGSQFFQQPSQISNISQFFQKQELPYQKIKVKRQQQIKLFEKTASYIKSLKKAMEEKNKKIKLLEKKIESMKSSELVRKQIGMDIEIKEDRLIPSQDRLEADDVFKDYQSVQLEYRRGGHLRRYRQLEHDTNLVIEENNLLTQQIESLEQELLKAEQQQNSLVKIKDLYKEQIKKLIKKNEQQTKAFEQELKNERKRVEDSQSVHNIEAIKQLFMKIIQISGLKFNQEMTGKKKQEKRKQLEQYVKVMSNILKFDKKAKDSLMAAIQK